MKSRNSFMIFCAFLMAAIPPFLFAEEQVHVLQKGETIYSLSRKYGVKEEEILFLNGIEDARKLYVGQTIRIPGSSIEVGPINTGPETFIIHTAAHGETLFGIARLYDITLAQLRAANKLNENYVLKTGDKLKIPSVEAVASPKPPASPPKPAAKPAVQTVDKSLLWPVNVKDAAYMTGKLSGVVLTGIQSESVRCIAEGTVVSAGPYRGFGRVVIVQTPDAYLYVYGGLESLSVKEGDKVQSGAELGRLGLDASSGKSDLFFMVYKNNAPIDPGKAPRT